MTAQPPSISTLQTMAPPPLDHVVRTCLEKDPEERWQTAHDVEVELKWIATSGAVSQAVAFPAVARLHKRERLAWIVAACLPVLLVVVWAILQPRPAPEARVMQFEIALPEKGTLGELDYPALSPDGQYVAIPVVSEGGQSKIWVRALNSPAMTSLPGTEGGTFPSGHRTAARSRSAQNQL
jgi:hypothetical protein